MGKLTLHSGIVRIDERLVRYYHDTAYNLPLDIQNYQVDTVNDFSWSAFFQEVIRGEAKGFYYNIQIGDLFYETLDKED